jgi:ABC-type Mn2+/Zn2+ transport system permease subunit/predicted extracellular nuclease
MTDGGGVFGLPATSVAAALLAALVCGLVGTFVVLRRLVALGGGIAHAAFGGIGAAVVLGVDPRLGAAAVAVGAAALLARLPRERSDRQDALIGVLWAVGMAAGMLLLAGSPSADADVEGYLFGDIGAVRGADLVALGALVLAVVAVYLWRGRELVAVAFDPEHARLQGLPVGALSLLLLTLVALSVVALLQLVGVVLAIALLAIPPLVALRLCRSLPAIVVTGAAVAFAVSLAGLALGRGLAWPSGPSIVLVGAAALALSRMVPRRARRAAAALLASAASTAARGATTAPSAMPRAALELIGSAVVAPRPFEGEPVGGLSALAYDAREGALYALSDDRGERGEPRVYRLKLELGANGRLDDGEVEVVGRTPLRTPSGAPFERGSLDPEGLALTSDGAFVVASEGIAPRGIAPFVARFARDGHELSRYPLAPRFTPDPAGVERGVRDNLGFESLAVTPDGRYLIAGLENALRSDGPAADVDAASVARLVVWPVAGGTAREFPYRLAPLTMPVPAGGGFRVNGLTELVALSASEFLSLEREYVAGAGIKVRLFVTSLDGATEVQSIDRLHESAAVPARKWLLVDFSDLGLRLDNYEGLALGPPLADGRSTLFVVSDDNFNPAAQETRLIAFALDRRALAIATLQGAAHRSPFEGQFVSGVEGVVTAIDRRAKSAGFTIESSAADGDPATSEGLWVAASPGEDLAVGDRVRLAGRIEERAANSRQLSVTTLTASAVEEIPDRSELPPPFRFDAGAIPSEVDDDALGAFEPAEDAIDFWESLESMRVELPDAVVTGPTLSFGEVVLMPADEPAAGRSEAGGRLLAPDGPSLGRWFVGARFLDRMPDLEVGARVAGPLRGVVDYSFSNYKVQLTEPPVAASAGFDCAAKTTLVSAPGRLTVATLNVENLSVAGPPERFARFATTIVERLASPALVALEEIQDDSGTTKDDGVVTAESTLRAFTGAVAAAGGPRYESISIDPELDREGGVPGGNIRVVLLFDPQRVRLARRGAAESKDAAEVVAAGGEVRLEPNPGRVAPTSAAFTMSSGEGVRRSLAVELEAGGEPLFVVVNHWSSKFDDDRAFGATQPPRRPTGAKRLAQAKEVRAFAERILAADADARVLILGDLNDLPWSEPIELVSRPPLVNLMLRVPAPSRYTYNFEGSAQAIDYVVVSPALADGARIEPLHINSNCPESLRVSDHDPIVVSLRLAPPS